MRRVCGFLPLHPFLGQEYNRLLKAPWGHLHVQEVDEATLTRYSRVLTRVEDPLLHESRCRLERLLVEAVRRHI